jgi:polysaccharide export outer membrane protein
MLLASSLVTLLSVSAGAQTQKPQTPRPPASPAPVGTGGTVAPTTNAVPPAREAGSPSTAADYRLVTGDKLRIEVYKDSQLSQSLQIRPDGKITLPLAGDIPAAGRTSLELRDTVTAALKDYVNNPVVTVIVVETMPQTIYVMGEVHSPGPQSIKGDISILQALAMAGGFKDFAKRKSIKVLRPGPAGNTTIEFNYNDALEGKARMVMLRPGDTVIIP